MSLLLETIKIQNRQACNLPYHNERFNRVRRTLFNIKKNIDLQEIIQIPIDLDDSIHKCRVIYDIDIQRIEFLPYQIKPIRSLQLIEADELEYAHKYFDRSAFTLLSTQTAADDILIVKNGYLTDTSYANIVFWDGNQWITPATPLLPGTKRQYLLDIKQIESKKLRPADIQHFAYARLINAMLDLDMGPVIPIENIF